MTPAVADAMKSNHDGLLGSLVLNKYCAEVFDEKSSLVK
jgi:hypothetical protein